MALLGRFEVKFAFFLLGLALLSSGAHSATVFDVTKFDDGQCKADGRSECAPAFMQAWNAACKSRGPSNVVIPAGTYMAAEMIFSGPCNHSKPITLEIHGTVFANPDGSEYPNTHWILLQNVDGLLLKGGGTFKPFASSFRPSMVFNKVNNSMIQGFNMVNDQGVEIKIGHSHNFTVQNLHITAPKNSPSTDGIHISQSDLFTISNCTIVTGGQKCIFEDEGATHVTTSAIKCGHPRA